MNTSPDVLFLTGDDTAYPQISELKHLGFQVHRFAGLSELYLHLSRHAIPLVALAGPLSLVDIAAAQLRVMRPTLGIVAMTRFPDSDSRVRTLLSGADACLDTEVSSLELAAVFQSLLRRTADNAPPPNTLSEPSMATWPQTRSTPESRLQAIESSAAASGGWRLTSKGWGLMAPTGQTLSLTTAERSLLLRFAHAPDKRLARDTLSADMAGGDGTDSERRGRFVDVMISRMRRKAAAQRVRLPIKAVHGWGYMFTADLIVDADIPDLENLTAE